MFTLGALAPLLSAQTGAQVLLVGNSRSAESREIVDYYRPRRAVPAGNVCWISTTTDEEISWNMYEAAIEQPIGECLKKAGLREKVLYIALTLGVPLKIDGTSGQMASRASVDSELALLYGKLRGRISTAPARFRIRSSACGTRRSAIRNSPSIW